MRLGGSLRRRRRRVRRVPRGVRGGRWGRLLRSGSARLAFVKKPRFLALLGALVVVGFGLGYLFSTQVLFPQPPPPGDLVSVPDLSGETAGEASASLSTIGLVLGQVDSLRHPTVPEGAILGQSPLPGQLSLGGDTVRVAISTGPERRPVPDVVRLRADRAQTVLEASGFSVVVDSVDSEMPQGGVVLMDPEPGTDATLPREVRLTVSKGPPLVEMPVLLGLEEEEAKAVLDSLGFVVGEVETRFRFGRDQGLVVEQDPPARTLVPQGSSVRLVVGRRGGGAATLLGPRAQEQSSPRDRKKLRIDFSELWQ
jgi:beta-lactam-binding protein with PASTA domain